VGLLIDSYDFGTIVINGKKYTTDVIVFPDRVRDRWWRKEGHCLHLEDLQEVLDPTIPPEVLVIGTGYSGVMRVPNELVKELSSRRIQVIAQPTKQACQTFEGLLKSGRGVVAVLHITC